MTARLVAILQVEKEDRVQCQQPGCAHGVYRAIHVVAESDGDREKLSVLGSTCFAKRFGRADALGQARYGGGQGRALTPAERQLLVDNTAALLAQLEQEREAHELAVTEKLNAVRAASERERQEREQVATERLNAMRATIERQRLARERAESEKRKASAVFSDHHRPPVLAAGSQPSTQLLGIPWSWAKPLSSIAYFKMRDGTGWVRVQHRNNDQILMPWPPFDGWDETLPAKVGVPDLELGGLRVPNIVESIEYLKTLGSMKVGIWREVIGVAKG